ncbi:GGDEF domain-containing protein [Chitinimonas sp. BJB300]|uniref:GGDEF domain-containing protein n=1 Tax=Chitinimonas sp. BJB300 TaxID=1559339 RepID=UPI000C0E6910|nr:diguanylate cyclase [Chitinimonas sp. BJB300]PHV11720.1 diguanylate cyclase response regulator [Chitinimonas sp. BJB300]TSJ89997.1 diguanylate cyclase [Chitinimonas sp. BJB300]
MSCPPVELHKKSEALRANWHAYQGSMRFEQFVEFAISVSSFAGFLDAKALSGLHQVARDLEQQTLNLFGDETSHPITPELMNDLDSRLDSLLSRMDSYIERNAQPKPERRAGAEAQATVGKSVSPSRRIWFFGEQSAKWQDLMQQLRYFGIVVEQGKWEISSEGDEEAIVVLFEIAGLEDTVWAERIRSLRQRFAAGKLIGLGITPDFDSLQTALSAGCDFCLPQATPLPTVMAKILELNDSEEEAPYRVLVVEDSLTATKLIVRSLNESSVESFAIANPSDVLTSLKRYQPDLILMDMYMPGCTGVEAARVIRQHSEFLSIPIVYLSGETDVALQIDALRLGGDHFLTKPFNPVILNAIVRSKIERYRALRRSMFHDSLTGLLNHTSSKQRLDAAINNSSADQQESLSVAMIDIDHFKKVNDTYGHPVGDQIIRSLAWLLKQRLRKSDIVGRYGGEEFMVGLPNTNGTQAYQVLDRIRRDFSQIKHPFNDTWFHTTFSCGIACYPDITNSEALVKAADEALYEAKRAGRNKVIMPSECLTPVAATGV